MPDPTFDQPTDETPSSSETATALNAILQTSAADLEAQMQAIVAESTATIARLDDELQTMLAESKAKMDALIADAGSFKIEQPPRQFNIESDLNLGASFVTIETRLETLQKEADASLAALRQNSLLHTTTSPDFWKARGLELDTIPSTAITLEPPKGP